MDQTQTTPITLSELHGILKTIRARKKKYDTYIENTIIIWSILWMAVVFSTWIIIPWAISSIVLITFLIKRFRLTDTGIEYLETFSETLRKRKTYEETMKNLGL